MPRLTLHDVRVTLHRVMVVKGVDAAFEGGRLVAIAGPNGAGKTTLVRAIAGLVAYSGSILLGTADAVSLGAKDRARLVGYLPQGHQAHWPLPVFDIVALGRFAHGARDPAHLSALDRAAIDRALHITDTARFARRPVSDLSGGERARVALARVLAGEAPILLADEPTAALDPRYRIDMMRLLRQVADAGTLVLAVTHDLALAARLADEVLVLNEGRVAALGAPARALSEDVYRDIFRVTSHPVAVDGGTVLIPWDAAAG
jgi:iron complex transport system ATP-binding protein